MASSLRTATLDAALHFIPSHSFTRQTIKEGYLVAARRSSPLSANGQSSTSRSAQADNEVDSAVDMIFGPGESSAGKALVGAWEKGGLEFMVNGEAETRIGSSPSARASSSTASSGEGSERNETKTSALRNRLKRRLEYSEQTAGEGLVQAHALLQASTAGTSIPLPKTLGYMIDRIKGDWEGWEVYTPPNMSEASLAGSSSATGSVNEATSHGGTSGDRASLQAKTAHHVPLPIPPNPLRSLGYAWRIIDQAMYLDHLSRVDREAGGEVKRNTEERMVKEREGEGLGWYRRRLGLSLIYLRAESVLMLPRNQHFVSTNESPLERATNTLDSFLHAYARAGAKGSPSSGGHLGGASGADGQILKETVEFGKFVYNSWGGLFRSRGWIR